MVLGKTLTRAIIHSIVVPFIWKIPSSPFIGFATHLRSEKTKTIGCHQPNISAWSHSMDMLFQYSIPHQHNVCLPVQNELITVLTLSANLIITALTLSTSLVSSQLHCQRLYAALCVLCCFFGYWAPLFYLQMKPHWTPHVTVIGSTGNNTLQIIKLADSQCSDN